MDKAENLIPEYFSFMKGVVDTDELSLNISREILQQNTELDKIAKNIEKKISSELQNLLKNDREKYITLWEAFGRSIKFGVQDLYGIYKDKLKDLLIFKSSFEDKYVTLKEYVERMKEEQKEILYVSGENIDVLKSLPKMKVLKEKGLEVLFLTDRIDEFTIKTLAEYEGKQFKSINDSDFDMDDEESKKEKRKFSKRKQTSS